MTIWMPKMVAASGPKYRAIADALSRDVEAGRLRPGARLPTQRELADALGVTVGTVTRAYAEARQRGLIAGEVGRGTFVREHRGRAPVFGFHDLADADAIELSLNAPEHTPAEVAEALAELATSQDLPACVAYPPHLGLPRHRAAGARWLRECGVEADECEVVVTAGAQHAMLVALSVVCNPGDVVACEQVVYGGLRSIARLLRLRLAPVAVDADGMVPEELERVIRDQHPTALYLTPTLQNPTATIMPPARRQVIAELVRTSGVTLIEDDIYQYLLDEPPPPVATWVGPEAYYLTSLSKSVAAGLRVGYLRAPCCAMDAISAAMMATTVAAPSISGELATMLVNDGRARQVAASHRVRVAEHQALARARLGRFIHAASHPAAMHVWLELPEPWRTEEFAGYARRRGVGIASAEMFAVGRASVPHAARVSVGAIADRDRLIAGLDILADLLEQRAPAMSVSV